MFNIIKMLKTIHPHASNACAETSFSWATSQFHSYGHKAPLVVLACSTTGTCGHIQDLVYSLNI